MGSIEYSTTIKDGETKYAMFMGNDSVRHKDQFLFNTREDCVKFWAHYGFKAEPEHRGCSWLWYVREVIA